MKIYIPLTMLMTMLFGCLSIAKISEFPKSSTEINFDRYSTEYTENKDPFWTANTSNEYYFQRDKTISEKELIDIIQYALKEKGYSIYSISIDNNNVLGKRGKRGMYANEWNSITGVYYKIDLNKQKLQIYIITQITQDITGGWSENRAKKVGLIVENMIDSKN